LNKTFLEFIEFRKKNKSPMTDKAIDLAIKKLNGLSSNINEQIEILNQSILNSWKGIFPLKDKAVKQDEPRKPIKQTSRADTIVDQAIRAGVRDFGDFSDM
jgi:hypothetical protein